MTVRRYDLGKLDAPVKTAQGFLRVPATIARTGIQIYRQQDGSERREYRAPEEVGHKDALASFSLSPLTLLHPSVPVTAENAKKLSTGTIGEDVRFNKDTGLVESTALVTDVDAIRSVEQGMRQLSCGYECDVDETPGVTPEGEKYDAVQKNIRGNHVAIVPQGRAGPRVSLRLDSNNQAVLDDEQAPLPATSGDRLMKLKIDGIEVEVPDLAAQLVEKERKAHADALETAKTDAKIKLDAANVALAAAQKDAVDAKSALEKEKARADAATEAKTKAEKAHADAIDPVKVKAAINARVKLEKTAAALAPGVKTDGLDEAAVRKAVVAELHPDIKVDSKSPEYIAARFDMAFEDLEKTNPSAAALAGIFTQDTEAEDKKRQDAEDAADPRKKMMKDNVDASRKMGSGVSDDE